MAAFISYSNASQISDKRETRKSYVKCAQSRFHCEKIVEVAEIVKRTRKNNLTIAAFFTLYPPYKYFIPQ